MAWGNATIDGLNTGNTNNDYYFTDNRSGTKNMASGGWSDITHIITFSLCDYRASAGDTYFYSLPAGDYYIAGDAQAGIFVRKTGAANTKGQITIKASYNGQADSGATQPETLGGAWNICSNYSGSYYEISIICGINEETHRGTIFSYRKWNTWTNTGNDWQLSYCNYGRYTNSEVAYNLIKRIMPSSYNWVSVPSVVGNGKIIQLPQIISTDGNPISSGSASDFSTIPTEAIVKTLADANVE